MFICGWTFCKLASKSRVICVVFRVRFHFLRLDNHLQMHWTNITNTHVFVCKQLCMQMLSLPHKDHHLNLQASRWRGQFRSAWFCSGWKWLGLWKCEWQVMHCPFRGFTSRLAGALYFRHGLVWHKMFFAFGFASPNADKEYLFIGVLLIFGNWINERVCRCIPCRHIHYTTKYLMERVCGKHSLSHLEFLSTWAVQY